MKNFIYKYLPIFFGCHTRNDRSFFYKDKKFPICARCTGELIGIILAPLLLIFYKPSFYFSLILMIPMLLDGFTQLLTKYESNNIKRLITGLLFGYALCNLFMMSVVFTYKSGQSFRKSLGLK